MCVSTCFHAFGFGSRPCMRTHVHTLLHTRAHTVAHTHAHAPHARIHASTHAVHARVRTSGTHRAPRDTTDTTTRTWHVHIKSAGGGTINIMRDLKDVESSFRIP